MDARVLLTGATGYIGGRLLRRFEEGGRAGAVPRAAAAHGSRRPGRPPKSSQGDCLDEASLDRALAGVRLRVLPGALDGGRVAISPKSDRRAAENFGRAAARAGVRRIIYLGGLADDTGSLSAPSEEPGRDRRGPSRERRPRHRVPRVDRHRRRKPVVRDDSGAGRAAARHGLSALGRDAHAAHRHRRRAGVSGGGARPARGAGGSLRDRRTRGRRPTAT